MTENVQKQWVLATHNAGKINELNDLISPYGVLISGAAENNLPEPDETEPTFSGNAALKARSAVRHTGKTSLADDSGLCINALDGAPGIYSARWAGEPRDFARAMEKVQSELKASGSDDYSAAFVCVLALAEANGDVRYYKGVVEGIIVWPPRGTGGFGYDPIFVPEGESRTFGEMTAAEKAAYSHRGRAMEALFAGEFKA